MKSIGKLIGIARACGHLEPMVEAAEAQVDIADGIIGDARGRAVDRQVTVLFREGWEAACGELGVILPWIARRANLFVEGVGTPRQGARLAVGDAVLEVTKETNPSALMDRARDGLRVALQPDWRGCVFCNVITGGTIRVGDEVGVG